MTDAETNQIVHEALDKGHYAPIINLVGEIIVPAPNYLEHGKPWGDMLNWAMKQEWWSEFEYNYIFNLTRIRNMDTYVSLNIDLFANPRSLAEHIAEYLEGLKDG